MAKSTGTEGGGETEATTLIFPKKSAWEELVEAKITAKKRSSSANGAFSKVVARLVEDEHMDRRAARILVSLVLIEDDEDLHVTFHHLMDGIQKLKLHERAMAAPDFFTNVSPQVAAAGARNAKGGQGGSRKPRGANKGSEADLPANVSRIGDAARKVAEEAGGATA